MSESIKGRTFEAIKKGFGGVVWTVVEEPDTTLDGTDRLYIVAEAIGRYKIASRGAELRRSLRLPAGRHAFFLNEITLNKITEVNEKVDFWDGERVRYRNHVTGQIIGYLEIARITKTTIYAKRVGEVLPKLKFHRDGSAKWSCNLCIEHDPNP